MSKAGWTIKGTSVFDNGEAAQRERNNMSEAKFTKGPWTVWNGHADVYAGEIDSNTPGGIMGSLDSMRCVAICDSDESLPPEEEQANAHLIAAAPDLLAACEEMKRTLTSPTREISDVTRRELLPWLPMLDAAIARAKPTPDGEQTLRTALAATPGSTQSARKGE